MAAKEILVPLDGSTLAEGALWAAQRDRAFRYLADVYARPVLRGVRTTVAVELGSPAETILNVAQTRDVSRIVMTTHGRTGVTRWVFGSVADKVLGAADRTVVLVRSAA